jgi:hypothetical protein
MAGGRPRKVVGVSCGWPAESAFLLRARALEEQLLPGLWKSLAINNQGLDGESNLWEHTGSAEAL